MLLGQLVRVLHQERLNAIDHLARIVRHSKVGVAKSGGFVNHLPVVHNDQSDVQKHQKFLKMLAVLEGWLL